MNYNELIELRDLLFLPLGAGQDSDKGAGTPESAKGAGTPETEKGPGPGPGASL